MIHFINDRQIAKYVCETNQMVESYTAIYSLHINVATI